MSGGLRVLAGGDFERTRRRLDVDDPEAGEEFLGFGPDSRHQDFKAASGSMVIWKSFQRRWLPDPACLSVFSR